MIEAAGAAAGAAVAVEARRRKWRVEVLWAARASARFSCAQRHRRPHRVAAETQARFFFLLLLIPRPPLPPPLLLATGGADEEGDTRLLEGWSAGGFHVMTGLHDDRQSLLPEVRLLRGVIAPSSQSFYPASTTFEHDLLNACIARAPTSSKPDYAECLLLLSLKAQ